MAASSSLNRIEKIQEEIQGVMSETREDEEEVGEDLREVEEKIEYLEENAKDARERDELNSMVDLFVDACHHLVEDVRAEKEIRQEIEQLEQDEKTYVQLMNRLQSEDLPEEKETESSEADRENSERKSGKSDRGGQETGEKRGNHCKRADKKAGRCIPRSRV